MWLRLEVSEYGFFSLFMQWYIDIRWFCLEDRIRLFVHYTISLSSLCKLIWRHWTYKMPVRYIFVECVSKISHILSVIHYTIRGAVCFQFTNFPCDDWENIYTLSYYHHQIGSMSYYPLFRVRSWNNGVRCMSFCILMVQDGGIYYRYHSFLPSNQRFSQFEKQWLCATQEYLIESIPVKN